MTVEKAWRCTVCGFVYRGEAPPDICPVCGAPSSVFDLQEEAPRTVAVSVGSEKWRCLNCSYVHLGGEPPGTCPVCGVGPDSFEPHTLGGHLSQSRQRRIVIVGSGIAGISAAESIRGAAPDTAITIVSTEEELPQYRLNLSRYVAGEIGPEALPIHPESWYEEQRIDLLRGVEVVDLGLGELKVRLREGGDLAYDRLILAVGSHPFVPPIEGARHEGVETFRNLEDAEKLIAAAKSGARCVIIGGGILGLETAGGLARRGAEVTVLEGFGRLLPRQLEETGAGVLQQHVSKLGIQVRTVARTTEIEGSDRVTGVRLDDGTKIPAELVVMATGVRSNTHLARNAGLRVNHGVVVDDNLYTSSPNILAAGDVAEHRGIVYGLWTPAHYQGNIAGLNAAGVDAEFGGIPRSNSLKVLGLDMLSIGVVEADDGSYTVMDDLDEEAGHYRRFVFRDGVMVGATLLGDTSKAAVISAVIEGKRNLTQYLRPGVGVADVCNLLVNG